jgi:hypothetical protein
MVKARVSSKKLVDRVVPLIHGRPEGRGRRATAGTRKRRSPRSRPRCSSARPAARTPLEVEAELFATADAAASVAAAAALEAHPLHRVLANAANAARPSGHGPRGLIYSFSAVGQADPAQRSAFLASGIAEALNCTAFGLHRGRADAVPHSFFSRR